MSNAKHNEERKAAIFCLSIVLGLTLLGYSLFRYLLLILAFMLIAWPVYRIVTRRTPTDDDNNLWTGLLVLSSSVSGVFFSVSLVCYQGYSHYWLLALPLLSGGSVYFLLREHATVVQAKLSIGALIFGLLTAWGIFYMTLTYTLASTDYYIGVLSETDSGEIWLLEVFYESDFRRSAAYALGRLGDKRAVDPLIKALADDDFYVRWGAVWALGRLGDKRAADPLVKALADKVSNVRKAAAEALEQLGDKRAVDPLIEALSDDDIWVRNAAEEALKKLGHKQ